MFPRDCPQERDFIVKTAAIIILILGLIMTLYAVFIYVTDEMVADLSELQMRKDEQHRVNWQPYVGIGAMVIGGVVLIVVSKRPITA
jgi:hypothetical protein